jgi:hypothetical protein
MTAPDQTPSARRGLAVFAVALAWMTAACTGGAILTTASPAPSTPPRPTQTTAAVATASVAPAEPTPIPIGTGPQEQTPGAPGRCDTPGRPCQFTAGTYQTYGRWAFLPGLTMDIPDGWTSTEQDAGEFNLQNSDFPDGSGLFFWRDVIPVEPDGSHVMTVPSTVAGITGWLRADAQLVVTDPKEKVIGKGLATTTFVVEVAKGALNKHPHCAEIAPKQTCFPILTDPAHWGDGAWSVWSTESSRYYLATIGPVSNRHLLVVALVADAAHPGPHDGADAAAQRLRFEKAVAPILDSLDVSRVTFN